MAMHSPSSCLAPRRRGCARQPVGANATALLRSISKRSLRASLLSKAITERIPSKYRRFCACNLSFFPFSQQADVDFSSFALNAVRREFLVPKTALSILGGGFNFNRRLGHNKARHGEKW